MSRRIGGLILAAGLSSRMGDFKPLMPLRGKTLIENSIDSLPQRSRRVRQSQTTICFLSGRGRLRSGVESAAAGAGRALCRVGRGGGRS